jgi:hypothetical protein
MEFDMRWLIALALALTGGCTILGWRDGSASSTGLNVSSDDPDAKFSRVRVSPMGPGQYMISCVDSPQICANEANRLCPAYDVVSNVTNQADYGRMTMIIKCHSAP